MSRGSILNPLFNGAVIALLLPPDTPLYVAATSVLFASVIVRQLSGGRGSSFLNAAAAGRIFIRILFPLNEAALAIPGENRLSLTSLLTGPRTPVPADLSQYYFAELFMGRFPSFIGTSCAVMLLAGLIYLLAKKVLKPYLPVFAGRVVESVNETERFLEDFRRVLADLFAENYAGRLTQLCHKYGLLCSIEPYGSSNADDLQYGQDVDVPMAEFWSRVDANGRNVGNTGNSRFASYLTESFTASPGSGGRWKTTPYSIKAQGDRVYSEGINRIIYHRFVHQPWPGNKYVPGMTMGRWGMHLDRTQTWWPLAGEWFRYQTRCQWMLQEGRFAADVLYWCGEAAPNSGKARVSLPPGYSWDICATKAVEMLKVRNGKVVTPGGVEYEILVLPSSGASIARTEGVVDAGGSDGTMSERMVRKIGALVDAGARVVAPSRPNRAPGLAAGPDADARLRAAVKEVWAKGVMECSAADALKRLGVKPDFASETPGVSWIHRTGTAGSAAGADWYFVALGNETNATFEASFRQAGRIPEVWDAETGCVRDAPVWREENGRTVVTLDFRPSGSAFVVFRRPAAAPHATGVKAVVSARPEPALPEKGHTLVIKKAVYGVFSGSERPECANVTKLIKPRTTVKVNNDAMGGDPSFGKVKQLEVRYVVGGETRRDVVAEGSRYRLPKEAKVIGAWYGVIDPAWEPPTGETTVDITAKLASLVKDGAIDVTVENELAGHLCVRRQGDDRDDRGA